MLATALLITIICTAIVYLHAKKYNRDPMKWAIGTFLFPPIMAFYFATAGECTILQIVGRQKNPRDTSTYYHIWGARGIVTKVSKWSEIYGRSDATSYSVHTKTRQEFWFESDGQEYVAEMYAPLKEGQEVIAVWMESPKHPQRTIYLHNLATKMTYGMPNEKISPANWMFLSFFTLFRFTPDIKADIDRRILEIDKQLLNQEKTK